MFNSCAVSGEAKILGENQVVAAFFDGTLGHIHEAGLVGFPSAAKSFGNIDGNRDGLSLPLWINWSPLSD